MAGNATALAAAWSGLSGSTIAKLNVINSQMVASATADVPSELVKTYLQNRGRLAGLTAYLTASAPNSQALLAVNYLLYILTGADGGLFKAASDPTLLTIMAGLTADVRTGITAGDLAALTNATTPQVPFWQSSGYSGPIGLSDLIAAGNLF